MADVYDYIVVTGVIVPDTKVIQDDVVAEFRQTFGSNLVVTPNTPQGLLITGEVAARTSVADNNAALANQINRNVSGGVYLDALGALFNSNRTPATPSTVSAVLTGVDGTVVPSGSLASDSVYNNIFQTTEAITILGDTTATMTSVNNGQIVAGAGTLTQILSNVIGWETITNPESAVPGTVTQSDEQYRNLQRVTLAAQGAATAEAIVSGVNLVTGVGSSSFLENVASTTQTIDGVVMVGHSIYMCVDGGTDLEVATAIQSKKSAGASYNNGATGEDADATPVSQDVVVPYSGQTITVLFDRPGEIVMEVAVSVVVNQPVQDPITTVQIAILNYVNGLLDGLRGFVVGQNVSPWEISGAITSQYPGIYVQDLQIQNVTASSGYLYTEIPIAAWQIATLEQSAIHVTVL